MSKGCPGLPTDVEPAQDAGLEDAQGVLGGGGTTGRRRHLLHPREADEPVAEPRRARVVPHRLDQLVADGERRARRRVVHPGRLEVDVLVGPAHRPVGLPDQLALVLRREVGGAVVVADRAGIGQVGRLVVVRRHGGRVATAVAAIGLEREVADIARARRRLPRRSASASWRLLLGARRGASLDLLRAVLLEHGPDLCSMTDGAQHLVAVDPGPVALGLGDRLHLGPESGERLQHRLLEVGRPRVVAAPGVGHGDERSADVIGVRRVDAGRHPAEAVVVVPHVQMAHRHAAASELLGHEVRHQELPQVAQVDRTRRRDPRRAGDGPGGPRLLVMPDRVVGGASDPVLGLALRRRSGHRRGLRSE